MKKSIRNRYFGDAAFYRKVLIVALPLIAQQLITSFVNMLDNIMVGQTGALPMSAVSVANQLVLIFNLAVFGSVSGASIFGAQFAGKQDWKGMRYCLRFKLIVEALIVTTVILLFSLNGETLIRLFLNPETNSPEDIQATLTLAQNYLRILMIEFVPFALSQCISSAIRETGETRVPMLASIVAVSVNFVGNWILIFGHFGAPRLGAEGAAIATVISRFAELLIILIFAIRMRERFPFFRGLFKGFHVPMDLAKDIVWRGFPLLLNEVLWSMSLAAITQCYSVRGIEALAAYNISSTITNLFFVFNFAMGDCLSIMVGQKLGAGDPEGAVDTDRKLIVVTLIFATLLGLILAATSGFFPQLYKVNDSIKRTAQQVLMFGGLTMWITALYNVCYFTMRCGGKTIITFLMDSVSMIVVSVPLAWVLAHFTGLPLPLMYLCVQLVDIYKVILGLTLVHKRVWVHDLVANH